MSSIGSNILEFADKWMDGGQERLLFVALSFIASAGTFYSVNLVVSIINHYDLYPEKRVRQVINYLAFYRFSRNKKKFEQNLSCIHTLLKRNELFIFSLFLIHLNLPNVNC